MQIILKRLSFLLADEFINNKRLLRGSSLGPYIESYWLIYWFKKKRKKTLYVCCSAQQRCSFEWFDGFWRSVYTTFNIKPFFCLFQCGFEWMYAHHILIPTGVCTFAKDFSIKIKIRIYQYNEPMIMKAYEIPVFSCLMAQGIFWLLKAYTVMYMRFST